MFRTALFLTAALGVSADCAGVFTQYTTSPWFDNPGSIPSGRNPGPSFNARNGNAPYASCSCCSANYSNTLASGGEGAIYRGFNYTCPGRPLSPECLFYLQAQEADFACNPNTQSLYYATVIPLCTTYIQAWWDACKNDYTCQADWVAWPQDSTGYMTCQAMNRPCMKYADIYKSATNLTFQWGAQNSVYSVSSDAAVCKSLSPKSFEGASFTNGPNPVCSGASAAPTVSGASATPTRSGASAAGVGAAALLVALVAASSRTWD